MIFVATKWTELTVRIHNSVILVPLFKVLAEWSRRTSLCFYFCFDSVHCWHLLCLSSLRFSIQSSAMNWIRAKISRAKLWFSTVSTEHDGFCFCFCNWMALLNRSRAPYCVTYKVVFISMVDRIRVSMCLREEARHHRSSGRDGI